MINLELVQSVIRGETFDPAEVVDQILLPACDLYHNGVDEESPLSDEQFDFIQRQLRQVSPYHEYFTGVGADIRGGKIDLPFPMGSLDQVEVGDWRQWVVDCRLSPDDLIVIMAKLDGSSGAALLKPSGALQIAYSRGNGFKGADITRHLKHVIKLPQQDIGQFGAAVRGENIISKAAFKEHVQPKFKRSGGDMYANPRNAVSGMLNSSAIDLGVYQYIDYVAYQTVGAHADLDKDDQLLLLESMGFKVPWYDVVKVGDITEAYLAEVINTLRSDYAYEIDGIVIEVNDATLRAGLEPEALNPGYAMKYKVPSDENQVETEVVEVEWNASKSSYGKPRVIVKSAILPGIVWTYATGYNAKWIVENGIGPGAIVVGQRMGDVVPNIIRVVKSVTPQMPDGPYHWNDTKVDIIMEGDEIIERVLTMQLTETARSLDINGLREGTAEKIVVSGGYESFNEMFQAIAQWPRKWWIDLIGENGGKIFDDFHSKLQNVPLHVWLGSMPHFGRGVGKRKMRALCEGLGVKTMDTFNNLSIDQITSVEGFKDKTANKVMAGINDHSELFTKISAIIMFQQQAATTGDRFSGQKVVITGFRDAAMEKMIESEGGEMQTTVSAKTTMVIAASTSGNSGKLKKVKDLNASGKASITLMDLAEFRKTYIDQKSTQGLEF